MKFTLLLFAFSVFAAEPKLRIEKVKSFEWNGKEYKVQLGGTYKTVVVPGNSKVAPCLENAFKSNMEVQVVIDPEVPRIESCKLYSSSLPFYKKDETTQTIE